MGELGSHMSDQVDVVIQVSYKVVRNVMSGAAGVSDELAFGHFVFDMGTGQVDGQQDETVAQDVNGIGAEAKLADQPGVACAEAVAEFGDEGLQIFSPLLRGVDVSEKVPQRVGEELVTEIMKRHQLVQDVSPLIQVNPKHLPVEPSGVKNELGQLCGVVHQNAFRQEVTNALLWVSVKCQTAFIELEVKSLVGETLG